MTTSNRMQLTFVRDTNPAAVLSSPRMRLARITGESLAYQPQFQMSDEIRADRMNADPVQVFQNNSGGVNGEWSYPVEDSWISEVLRSALFSAWTSTPSRDNDGVADSVITQVTAATQTVTVTTGPSFPLGSLVLFSGFLAAANNAVRRCTTAGATAPVFLASGLIDEAVPPAAARMKVVGFEGVSGDITATATGLASTTLDFTTFGLVPGMWIKIGGGVAGQQYNTTANNGWARISGAVTANAIPLDNRPPGWAGDAGTGKTIRVFFGDWNRNGVTPSAIAIERGFLGQATPNYILQRGLQVDSFTLNLASQQKITWTASFVGLTGTLSQTSVDAVPDPATTNPIMAANVGVGRIGEGGAPVAAPNWIKELRFSLNNNLRGGDAADAASFVRIEPGEATVSVSGSAYFGDSTFITKFFNGTPSALNFRAQRQFNGVNQATILEVPRLTYTGGFNPSAAGKNQDVMLPFEASASIDTLLNAHLFLNRIEYFE